MPIEIDEDFAEGLFDGETVEEVDEYPLDESYALVKKILSTPQGSSKRKMEQLKNAVNEVFKVFSTDTFRDELFYYKEMMQLANRLVERNAIKRIQDKAVVGLGGCFSAGKSKFLNSLIGNDVLPEDQDPTTSIPTYIIKGTKDSYEAYSSGTSYELNLMEVKALSHIFKKKYHMGFSSFIDSIFIERAQYGQSENLVFLDTPGYTKFDSKTASSKTVVSDRELAIRLLNKVDYLIWLVDVENLMSMEDIKFINDNLNVKTPVLVVLNKMDRKTPQQIEEYIAHTKSSLEETATFKVYDVVAYSSLKVKEFNDGHVIQDFLDSAASTKLKNHNIEKQFQSIEKKMRLSIENRLKSARKFESSLWDCFHNSSSVLDLKSLVNFLKREKQYVFDLVQGISLFDNKVEELNREVKKLLG